jgi:choice-of-anchor A domain-containing protein
MVRIAQAAKIAAVCVALAAGSAQAQTSAKDYNVFTFGSFTASGSDIQGGLAAGGNITISGYGVATGLNASANSLNTLVAGGTLTMDNGQLHHGNAVAGTLNLTGSATIANGTASVGSVLDFAAEQTRLLGISSSLAGQASNSSSVFQYGGYTLTGSQATGLNVFNVSGANLASTNNFVINAAANSFVLVNVDGSAASFQNAGFSLSGGITAEHILLNFSQASALTFGGIGLSGTILAPKANVIFNNGHLDGTLIALSAMGGGEYHYRPYGGSLLDGGGRAVPEPAAWAMLIGGFGMAGAAIRRKRRARAFA